MHTVLIVDDEEPVLDSYAFLLEGCPSGFSLAGKARNGYEAIKFMYEHKPDLVFMDIQMPGMDGLETLSEIHGKFPDTVFILSTAYERFDLARRAIPLGVHSYLVKPVTKKVFLETLAEAALVLERKKRSRGGFDDADGADGRGGRSAAVRFLSRDVWRSSTREEWEIWRDRLLIDSNRGRICIAGIDSDKKDCFEKLVELLSKKFRIVFAPYLDLGIFFFPGETDQSLVESAVNAALAEISSPDVVSFAGFGSLRDGPELRESALEALQEAREKRIRSGDLLGERLRVSRLRRRLGLGDSNELRELFETHWKAVFSTWPFETARARMIALFALLEDDASGRCLEPSEDSPCFDYAGEIASLSSVEEWAVWASSAFARLSSLAQRRRSAVMPIPLIKAMAYIEAEFDRPLQLSDAADAASVSPAYLSRLFSEHLNSTFVDCLTRLRIERAENLIRGGGLSIKEIAARVGYQDANYFSKTFRKVVGMSPSMYERGE